MDTYSCLKLQSWLILRLDWLCVWMASELFLFAASLIIFSIPSDAFLQ